MIILKQVISERRENMDYSEVMKMAKEKCTLCHVCPHCNGFACAGEIPGVGGKGSGSSFQRNCIKLKEIVLKMDTIVKDQPIDCTTSFFGKKVSLPIYVAPIAGIKGNFGAELSDLDYTRAMMEGTKAIETIAFSGDGKHIEMFLEPLSIVDEYNNGICTIKPWVKEGLLPRMEAANASNAIAIACDIDSAGLPLLKDSEIPVEFKSKEKLSEMISLSNKPFIVKGILSVEGARKAYEAGADGIVISNHGGRVLDDCVSSIEVLEEIADMYRDKMMILVDGGFRSGADVFKALAIGAHGVLIGRPATISIIGNASEGIQMYLNKIKNELKDAMAMCGCHTLDDISKKNIYKQGGY